MSWSAVTAREIEDIAGEGANAAEMKAAASGNPLSLEEMDTRRKLRRLDGQSIEHDREQYRIRQRIIAMRDEADRLEKRRPAIEAYAARAAKAAGTAFAAAVFGNEVSKPKEFGNAILQEANRLVRDKQTASALGSCAGFRLVRERLHDEQFVVAIEGDRRHEVHIADIGDTDATSLAMSVANTVKKLPDQPKIDRERMSEVQRQIPALEKQLGA